MPLHAHKSESPANAAGLLTVEQGCPLLLVGLDLLEAGHVKNSVARIRECSLLVVVGDLIGESPVHETDTDPKTEGATEYRPG